MATTKKKTAGDPAKTPGTTSRKPPKKKNLATDPNKTGGSTGTRQPRKTSAGNKKKIRK